VEAPNPASAGRVMRARAEERGCVAFRGGACWFGGLRVGAERFGGPKELSSRAAWTATYSPLSVLGLSVTRPRRGARVAPELRRTLPHSQVSCQEDTRTV
jgi:hypothetical protein